MRFVGTNFAPIFSRLPSRKKAIELEIAKCEEKRLQYNNQLVHISNRYGITNDILAKIIKYVRALDYLKCKSSNLQYELVDRLELEELEGCDEEEQELS